MARKYQKSLLTSAALILLGSIAIEAFSTKETFLFSRRQISFVRHAVNNAPATESFIQTELRGAAMRLHTREQSPKEGQVEVTKPKAPYVPTHADYLSFLVDSQHVYQTMEDIVNERDELVAFRNTGLERVAPLEKDIRFMMAEYCLERPAVGKPGKEYAEELRKTKSIPEFICHYYNHYFAHTAGGRMIGKQISALLLDKKTLEFYKINMAMGTWHLRFKRLTIYHKLTFRFLVVVGW